MLRSVRLAAGWRDRSSRPAPADRCACCWRVASPAHVREQRRRRSIESNCCCRCDRIRCPKRFDSLDIRQRIRREWQCSSKSFHRRTMSSSTPLHTMAQIEQLDRLEYRSPMRTLAVCSEERSSIPSAIISSHFIFPPAGPAIRSAGHVSQRVHRRGSSHRKDRKGGGRAGVLEGQRRQHHQNISLLRSAGGCISEIHRAPVLQVTSIR